jgi:ABC-type multidrug transport system fused ATPase/permease subunit
VFRDAEHRFRNARTTNAIFANAPRYFVEAAGMVLIAGVAVAMSERPGGLAAAIPALGALALGAQKLLPLVQQIYFGWAAATGAQQTLSDVIMLLRRPTPSDDDAGGRLPFTNAISLRGVSYSYGGERQTALKGIDLEIPKGARVGIAGRTGSGKSTLMDLVIGLLEPTEGTIAIDGTPLVAGNRAAWQRNVAHVPQAIFLSDASIAENIAFGVPAGEIDRERVQRAALQAELAEVVAALPEGYDTRVGERGIQLSGGQRQRIGIARALYKQANVLVFDEATSALDDDTESAVMSAIERLDRDLTIILIAHRLTTLQGCDVILRLDRGQVVANQPAEPHAQGTHRNG